MDRIVIIGSSGHAKVVIDAIERQGKFKIAGLVDLEGDTSKNVLGHAVIGPTSAIKDLVVQHKLAGAVVAIGDNFVRGRVSKHLGHATPDLKLVTVVHPTATIGKDVEIGDGTVVLAGAVINSASRVGRCCIVNTRASLDHDGMMGDYSSLAPGCVTGGNCKLGDYAAIGIGSTVTHGVTVGEHTVVGAGSTVVKNLGAYFVAYGTPAKQIRPREAGDAYH